MTDILHAGLSDKGLARPNNEDAWAALPEYGIYLVTDGMGGEFAGELASQIVSQALPPCLVKILAGLPDVSSQEFIAMVHAAIAHLSSSIRQQTMGRPGLDGMGATIVMAIIRDGKALVSHMGDSRAYLLRGPKLSRLTTDHSIVQLLLDAKRISGEEAETHPARGQLTRCVGMRGEPSPDSACLQLRKGDRMLLCSDGLTDMLSDPEIKDILALQESPSAICKKFVDAANKAGGRDNITTLVISCS